MVTLRGLQSSADRSNVPATMTWRALNSVGRSNGTPEIDYDRFAAQWDSEDETGILHQLVDNFDKNGIVVKTHSQEQEPQQAKKGAESAVTKMAKHALKK